MTQVIIYSNEKGGVSVCNPTNELPIDEVLAKDCPQDAIIFDDSTLPDHEFFDAWELIGGSVVVNKGKKSAIESQRQVQQNTKSSALSKLTALGLTPDEITALVGK